MKGLLIKDFMIIKKNCLLLLIISLGFFVLSLVSGKSMYFSYYSAALISIIPINTIAYDEAYRWNKYELLIPLGRMGIVFEKYLLLLILVLPLVLVEAIVFLFVFDFSFLNIIILMSLMLFCGVISPSIIFPVVFRFGYLKGKIVNVVIVAVLASSIYIINSKTIQGDEQIYGAFSPQKYLALFAIIAFILIILSFILSVNVYKKREI